MTYASDVILIILSAAFLLLAGFAVPVLLEIRRTAKGLAVTLETLNQELPGIMKNMGEISARVNLTTAVVYQPVEDLAVIMKKIQGTFYLLVGLEEVIRRQFHLPLPPALRTSLAFVKGCRVFLDHLLSKHQIDN
jgi:uncharacterized protein YoxC